MGKTSFVALAMMAACAVLAGCGGRVVTVDPEPREPDVTTGGPVSRDEPAAPESSSGAPGRPYDPSDASGRIGSFPANVATRCSADVVDVLDCAIPAGYGVSTYRPERAGDPELHVIGVYQTRGDHGGGVHPRGQGKVHVARRTRQVLALTSYEPTDWTVTVEPGVTLEKVILMGYHEHTAKAPAGVRVVDLSGPGRSPGCAYVWPGDDQGCNTQGMVGRAEHAAQAPIASFTGCYDASSFVVRDDAEICR